MVLMSSASMGSSALNTPAIPHTAVPPYISV
jgi:hypothetical protein